MAAPQGSPQRSPEEARANAAFEALLNANARPGSIHLLPETGFGPIIDALIDRECVVHATDPLTSAELAHTGARRDAAETADYLFGGADEAAPLARAARLGSDDYPDEGATLLIAAPIGQGQTLRLSGPGIETTTTLRLDGLNTAFWDIRRTRNRYPMGFDIVIVDGRSLAAIPRSTLVEVL